MRNELFFCKHCQNQVELVVVGGGTLTCCGEAMTKLVANSTDAANEKHVPVIVDKGDSIEVTVGSVEHPMEEKHYIDFIELITEKGICRKYLKPGEKPEATFPVKMSEVKEVREWCNLHRLWKNN